MAKKRKETEEEKELEKDLKGSPWERPRKSSAGTRRKKARREEKGSNGSLEN